MSSRVIFAAVMSVAVVALSPTEAAAVRPSYVQGLMRDGEVPGLAFAVV